MRESLTTEQRLLFPLSAYLKDWQLHCETVHGATPNDYRRNVQGWHRTNHPNCCSTPQFKRI